LPSKDKPSTGHSTFLRFRNRLSQKKMIKLNDHILQEFKKRGSKITEGIAVDARLVESASNHLSNDEIRKDKEKRNEPEGNVDKNGNALKCSKDLVSDWTVKNEKPHYVLKEDASVDTENEFVFAISMTPASLYDTKHLPC